MKKVLLIISILIILIGNTYASNYKLTNTDKLTINKITSKIEKLLRGRSLSYRSIIEKQINEIQQNNIDDKKMYSIFESVKKNTNLYNYEKEYTKHYNDNNIDFQKIKNSWLNWHNQARTNLGRKLYAYDQRLSNTSYEWSKVQNDRGVMSHKREIGDSYYNYPKIENWFNDRGVSCKVKGRTTSSESVGKYGYYCNDNDCTDELLKSLKKIFDIYMAEKGLGGIAEGHYRGITNENLTKIGLGLRIEEAYDDTYGDYRSYNYYVTTHYCTEFKK